MITIFCFNCNSVLGKGTTSAIARNNALASGHIIEPVCRGGLCLCRSCHENLTRKN